MAQCADCLQQDCVSLVSVDWAWNILDRIGKGAQIKDLKSFEHPPACSRVVCVDVHYELSKVMGHMVECFPLAYPVGLNEIEDPFLDENGNMYFRGGNIPRDNTVLWKRLAAVGISWDTTVLVYTSGADLQEGPLAAARFLWILSYAGVPDVRLIDGGLHAGRKQGLQLQQGWSGRKRVPTFHDDDSKNRVLTNLEYLATTEEVKACVPKAKTKSSYLIVDTRSEEEHTGITHDYEYFDSLGRIPGSINIPWGPSTYIGGDLWRSDTGTTLPIRDIVRVWQDRGLDGSDGKRVVMYCGTGWRSAYAWLLARVAGWRNVANYDGGWLEYSTLHPEAEEHEKEAYGRISQAKHLLTKQEN
eukprot:m.346903 g.346903  ORF g.346903 m.346903 type:complete len:358 (-) comp30640_c0_seq1:15-1088(-)